MRYRLCADLDRIRARMNLCFYICVFLLILSDSAYFWR